MYVIPQAKTSLIEIPSSSNDQSKADQSEDSSAGEMDEKIKDSYLFRSGRLPPYRQIFYQLKNICLPEAQMLIQKYQIGQCDEKNGWFKSGYDAKLRNLLAETIKQTCYFDDNASISTMQASSVIDDVEDDEEEDEINSD